jgi:uncharacterized membrane protein YqaE (UPF0057 family)
MEKRLYNKGYHIDWLSKKNAPTPAENTPIESDAVMEIQTAPIQNHTIQVVNNNTEATLASSQATPTFSENAAITPSINSSKNNLASNVPMAVSSPSEKKSTTHTLSELKQKNTKLVIKLLNKRNDDQMVLLIVLAIFLSPLSVYFFEGRKWTNRCTLNLILYLLCGVPGMVHALLLIFGKI